MQWSSSIFKLYNQRCPEATAHGDSASYSCPMRRLLLQKFIYSSVSSIVNVVIFAARSSQCAFYFEKCGQRCYTDVYNSYITEPSLGATVVPGDLVEGPFFVQTRTTARRDLLSLSYQGPPPNLSKITTKL